MKGTGRLRWFGPFLASRVTCKVFVNRTGTVEVADLTSCSAAECGWYVEASAWARGLSEVAL